MLDPYERFRLFGWFYFGKMWKFLEKRIWLDWGNTTLVDIAGLGSIGLRAQAVTGTNRSMTDRLNGDGSTNMHISLP